MPYQSIRVLVSASSICNEQLNDQEFSFKSKGPAGIKCQTMIKLLVMPSTISLTTRKNLQLKHEMQWYPREQVLRLTYENPGEEVNIVLTW